MLGARSLHYAVRQFLAHDHTERNHQGPANQIMAAEPGLERYRGRIARRERLGGLLSYSQRKVA
jgi:hypothetical protein